jgi:hypothetical protein
VDVNASVPWDVGPAARDFPNSNGGIRALRSNGRCSMRYVMAWILGVPFSVIVVWYIVGQAACR